ncbi:hypothetical protein D9M71_782540 [compost metagenome]
MLCSSEPVIDALEALTTFSDRSCTRRVAEDTSLIEAWMRSTKRLNEVASSPNSSLFCTVRRRVRSPSPSAMSRMARPMVVSGLISTGISRPSRPAMAATAMSMAMIAEVRNWLSAA